MHLKGDGLGRLHLVLKGFVASLHVYYSELVFYKKTVSISLIKVVFGECSNAVHIFHDY